MARVKAVAVALVVEMSWVVSVDENVFEYAGEPLLPNCNVSALSRFSCQI